MIKKEPIVDRNFSLYGFEILTELGKNGDDKGSLKAILNEIVPLFRGWDTKVFVNLPFSSLKDKEIQALIKSLSRKLDLVVEVLETEPFDPLKVPDLGVFYALDDYGTGWASLKVLLGALSNPLFKYIKLDRVIFLGFLKTKGGRKLLADFIDFISLQGRIIIFEKVETEEEFCELLYISPENALFQGYFVEKQIQFEFLW